MKDGTTLPSLSPLSLDCGCRGEGKTFQFHAPDFGLENGGAVISIRPLSKMLLY